MKTTTGSLVCGNAARVKSKDGFDCGSQDDDDVVMSEEGVGRG